VANPRVGPFVETADPVFAEQASIEPYPDFCRWLKEWESLADADGADRGAEMSHNRRHAELAENPDGGVSIDGAFGSLAGATLNEVFARFVEAEDLADWAEARARLGDAAVPSDLQRTPRQRRADALVAIFRRAAGASGASTGPLVRTRPEGGEPDAGLRRAPRGQQEEGGGQQQRQAWKRGATHRSSKRYGRMFIMKKGLGRASYGWLAAALVLAAGCGGDDPTEPEVEIPVDAPVVFMPGFSFSPFTTRIAVGGAVVFDFPAELHNVTFDRVQGAPSDIQATSNRQVARAFGARGTFDYSCTLHPGMDGVVIVE
jgi:plastocyanin